MDLSNAKKIMTVVGARPNFMKAAPIIAAIQEHNRCLTALPASNGTRRSQIALQSVLVHTGQHYDEAMSDRFFADLRIRSPTCTWVRGRLARSSNRRNHEEIRSGPARTKA